MSKVISLSYIIEDGLMEVEVVDSGDFKWWSYVVSEDSKFVDWELSNVWEENKDLNKKIEGIVRKWVEVEDEWDELECDKRIKEFVKKLKKEVNEFRMVSKGVEWSVEYDVNLSFIVSEV